MRAICVLLFTALCCIELRAIPISGTVLDPNGKTVAGVSGIPMECLTRTCLTGERCAGEFCL